MAMRKPPKPAALSIEAKKAAIPRLEARVRELEELDIDSISSGDDPKVVRLSARILSTLSEIYGEDSLQFDRLQVAANLDRTAYSLSLVGEYEPTPVNEIRDGLRRGVDRAISSLGGEADSLREGLTHAPNAGTTAPPKPREYGTDVFVVHGHDSPAKVEVARLLERAGLNAVILHEMPNAGRTIIEKFEAHGGSAGFAVVLLTPDDVGGRDDRNLRPRARQNVIGEMFWFAGKLGRKRVCALKKGDIELPSDFAGVIYTDMDDRGAWKAELLKELAAAGYTLDWAKAMV